MLKFGLVILLVKGVVNTMQIDLVQDNYQRNFLLEILALCRVVEFDRNYMYIYVIAIVSQFLFLNRLPGLNMSNSISNSIMYMRGQRTLIV